MNKLQQEIIEIIEPFMDKTLAGGCIVKGGILNTSIPEKEYQNGYDPYFINKYCIKNLGLHSGFSVLSSSGKNWTGLVGKPKDIKIIGHYDITAVLKYIRNEFTVFRIEEDFIYIWWQFDDCFNGKEADDSIPNKPLHLYTEQENKDLLELLKKLGNK